MNDDLLERVIRLMAHSLAASDDKAADRWAGLALGLIAEEEAARWARFLAAEPRTRARPA